MEDTWRPADLRRHIRGEDRGGGYVRRRDDYDRKHRGGESIERRHRDPEKESRREKERIREGESTQERRDEEKKHRKKEGSQDRRADRERDRRDEREREKTREKERLVDVSKYGNDYRENKERRRDREEKHDRERDKERQRDKEKERIRDSDRYNEEDHNKRREYGDEERKREKQAREHRADRDRRRHEENWEERRDQIEKHHREEKDRHREREGRKNEYEDKRNGKAERRGDRKHSEQKEDREYKEEHRKHKEERERRHRERGHRDEKQKHDSELREHQGDEIRHHRADRERADRDKHKERRYKDEEDPQRKHRERRHKEEGDVERKHKERRHRGEDDHRDKRSSSDRSHVPERKVVQTEQVDMVSEEWIAAVKHEGDTEEPVVNDEDLANQECEDDFEVVSDEVLANQEYEDDFEDYEEDFEELNESTNEDEDEEPLHPQAGEAKEELSAQQRKEIEEIQRAMDEENKRVGTAQSRQSLKREEEEERPKWSKDTEKIQSRASQHGKFGIVAVKQPEVSKKVANKLKKRSTELLRLIDLDFSMTFSLLDLPPVNEYDMYIRNFGNANTKQAYVQCNEDNVDRDIQTEEIKMSEKWSQHPPKHSGACGDPKESREKYRSEMNFDSQRLASFLCSASQVMVVLLEEDQAARKSLQKLSTQSDMQSFSDGSLQLNTKLPFLYGRQIIMLHFSQVQKHTVMSVHMPTTEPSAMALDSCTIICIWNIWEPSRPQRILVYESEIQCCCFSPGKATMVFAGTSIGSVVLWDLREQASNHNRLKMGEEEWTFRQPTFSTDSVMAASGHFSCVTSVEVVPSALTGELRPDIPLLASEEESSGLSFQLASLDERGVLNFWVVVELPKSNEAGSLTDLGLQPGGKVKLLHSSSLHTAERGSPRDVVKTGPLDTLLLKFLPTDSNHFFTGTNMGVVLHGTSHGLKAPPKFYRFQEVEVLPVDVTSIHFSPFRPHLFLVGCGNGTIRLHAVSHDQPVAQWNNSTSGEPVVSLQWAQTRPTVFCVLDAASNLHIWDLLKNDTQPVVTQRMSSDRVTAMAVFGDAGKHNTYSGVALAHESGKIEMQYFKRSLTVSCSAEEEKLLESMMTEAF